MNLPKTKEEAGLLEACKVARVRLKDYLFASNPDHLSWEQTRKVINQLEEAISKAEKS